MSIPDDLETYQTEIQLDTLYYIKNSGRGTEREDSAMEVKGGTVDVYGSIDRPLSPPAGMTLDREGFVGIDVFVYVPTFLYLTGDATSIIVSSLVVEEVV